MKYLKSSEIAKLWKTSERNIRYYCSKGRIKGAFISGKTWMIPENSSKPNRKVKDKTILDILREEKESKLKGRLYHKLQVEMTYNSNHIEGSKLSHEETQYIYDTNTIGINKNSINVDDIVETVNHFRCIDYVIDSANKKLNENIIKKLHYILKVGTSDSSKPWFNLGEYKKLDNEVGGIETSKPNDVCSDINKLLDEYNNINNITIEKIIDFHVKFERIHPFQDGNGRVGRLIILKECLKHNIIPFIILDEFKLFYYRGLKEYNTQKGYLIDTCLHGQDVFKSYLKKLNIKF